MRINAADRFTALTQAMSGSDGVWANDKKQKALLSKVGKPKMGKSCFYCRQLANLNTSVLEKLVVSSIAEFKGLHG
jgi:hypothetical protein